MHNLYLTVRNIIRALVAYAIAGAVIYVPFALVAWIYDSWLRWPVFIAAMVLIIIVTITAITSMFKEDK